MRRGVDGCRRVLPRLGSPEAAAVPIASGAAGPVEREVGRITVVADPRPLEPEHDIAAGGDGRVVVDVLRGDRRCGLADRRAPGVGDLLVPREGEGQGPAVDRARAGVGDRQARGESAGPFVLRVCDLTYRATGRYRADSPG